MIIKDYFADGLLQVAIVLSLLRTDLDSYLTVGHFGPSYFRPHELYETELGSLSSFTRTNLVIRDRSLLEIPKSIDDGFSSRFSSSIFRDLHLLGDYRRFNGLDTHIHTWLVNDAGPVRPTHGDVPTASGGADHATGSSRESDPPGSATEGAASSSGSDSHELYTGSELSKEDMELINILYMQDIDLGVGREFFDATFQYDAENDKRKREESDTPDKKAGESGTNETEETQHTTDQFPQLDLSGQYVIDTETGELVPVSSPINESVNFPSFAEPPSVSAGTPVPEVEPSTDRLHTDANTPFELNELNTLQTYTSGDTTTAGLQPPLSYERQSSIEQRWADVMSLLNDQPLLLGREAGGGDGGWDALFYSDTPLVSTQSYGTDSLVQNVSLTSVQPNAVNESFFLQSDLSLLSADPSAAFPPVNFSLDNISMPLSLAPNFTSSYMNLSLDSFPNIDGFNTDLAQNLTPSLNFLPNDAVEQPNFSLGSTGLTLPNGEASFYSETHTSDLVALNPQPAAASSVQGSSASSLEELSPMDSSMSFQQLLQNDLLDNEADFDDIVMDDEEEVDYDGNDEWSNDSAVSSMGSPTAQNFVGNSPESGGASGGLSSKRDVYNSKYDTVDSEYLDSMSPFSTDHRRHHTNTSANYSDIYRPPAVGAAASIKSVRHNHTYPLAPGQRSRAELEEEAKLEREARATRCRDEKRAKEMKIPLTMDEIIDSSVEHFTELLSRYHFTAAQHQLMRDIRRRGKNKQAAQNCRKRKMDEIQTIEEQVEALRQRRGALQRERSSLDRHAASLKDKVRHLESELFRRLHDGAGRAYDPSAYTLQASDDGGFFIVPRDNSTSSVEKTHDEKNGRKRKPKRKD